MKLSECNMSSWPSNFGKNADADMGGPLQSVSACYADVCGSRGELEGGKVFLKKKNPNIFSGQPLNGFGIPIFFKIKNGKNENVNIQNWPS